MEKIDLAQDIASIIATADSDSEALWSVISLIQRKYLVVDDHYLIADNPYNYMSQSGYLVQKVQKLLNERQEEN